MTVLEGSVVIGRREKREPIKFESDFRKDLNFISNGKLPFCSILSPKPTLELSIPQNSRFPFCTIVCMYVCIIYFVQGSIQE